MIEAICALDFLYKVPPKEIRLNRRTFYGLQKGRGELIKVWFDRVQSQINCCEFAKLTEVLLIDKFFCELGNDEMKSFQDTETWSLKKLNEYFFDQNVDTAHMHSYDNTNDENNDESQKSPIEALKFKFVSIHFRIPDPLFVKSNEFL